MLQLDIKENIVSKNKLNLSIDFRIISLLLLVALLACLALWRPWTPASNSDDQVIEVTGEATLKDKPDEFSFNPAYQFDTETKEIALAGISKKSAEVIDGLKKLGVKSESIKTNSSGYENPSFPSFGGSKVSYNLSLTVLVNDPELVQKVQDYLVSTSPSGSVTPFASFSENKRKSLERKGRTAATRDAREKADQTAEELGFKVGAVKSISDTGQQSGGVFPLATPSIASDGQVANEASSKIGVQPGQNELSYSVTVKYYIR